MASGRGQHFVNLLRDCWRTRAYGDFWSYMLVAEGAVDLAAEPELVKGAQAGVLHKNTASRKVSRLAARVKDMKPLA